MPLTDEEDSQSEAGRREHPTHLRQHLVVLHDAPTRRPMPARRGQLVSHTTDARAVRLNRRLPWRCSEHCSGRLRSRATEDVNSVQSLEKNPDVESERSLDLEQDGAKRGNRRDSSIAPHSEDGLARAIAPREGVERDIFPIEQVQGVGSRFTVESQRTGKCHVRHVEPAIGAGRQASLERLRNTFVAPDAGIGVYRDAARHLLISPVAVGEHVVERS